jgi:hypothetical protein
MTPLEKYRAAVAAFDNLPDPERERMAVLGVSTLAPICRRCGIRPRRQCHDFRYAGYCRVCDADRARERRAAKAAT